jgi:hypothetical protein
MYLGLAFVYLGVAIADQSVWALILLPVVLAIIQRRAIEPDRGISGKAFWRELYRVQGEGQALVIAAVLPNVVFLRAKVFSSLRSVLLHSRQLEFLGHVASPLKGCL